MKIIKWVRGIEHDADGKFHLLHPECWDKCANKPDEERERLWKEMEDAVIDSIRRNRFKFGGTYHQNGDFGMPMFEDGTIFFVSMRHWGRIMADAWHGLGEKFHSYLDFAWENDMAEFGGKVPKGETEFV